MTVTLRPYPIAALARACGINPQDPTWSHQVATQVRMSRSTVWRHRDGLSADEADTWAARCGLHPSEVWPAWWSDLPPAGLANALKERCPAGHPYDARDRDRRACSRCRTARQMAYKLRKRLATQVVDREAS